MTRRAARMIGAVVLALVLALWHEQPLPTAVSLMMPEESIPPPEMIYRSYTAGGRPVISSWLTAEAFFYSIGQRAPQPYSDDLYIDPAFEEWVLRMRPAILESARRHNHPELTGMDDRQFAVVLTAILFLENNAALNDRSEPGRAVTPLYQDLQVSANELGLGTDFSILPTNLRPSVAIDILRGRVPLPVNDQDIPAIYRPIKVHGSLLQSALRATPVVEGWTPPTANVTLELINDRLAIEYLAANLEVAQYRCQYEWVPVTWHTLVAWNSQGVVSPYGIGAVPGALLSIARVERYLPFAAKVIYNPAGDVRPGPAAGLPLPR